MYKIAIIDPSTIPDAELSRRIKSQPQWDHCGTYGSCQTGIDCLKADQPRAAIVKQKSFCTDGLRCLQQVREALPAIHIILYGPLKDWAEISQELRYGHSYVTDEAEEGLTGIVKALRYAERKKAYLSSSVLTMMIANHHQKRCNLGPFARLTKHEFGIVHDVCTGIPYAEIATRLGITEGGLRQHIHRIYSKLKVQRQIDLLRLYYKMLNGEFPMRNNASLNNPM